MFFTSGRIYQSIILVLVCIILFMHYCNRGKPCPPDKLVIRDTIYQQDTTASEVYQPIPDAAHIPYTPKPIAKVKPKPFPWDQLYDTSEYKGAQKTDSVIVAGEMVIPNSGQTPVQYENIYTDTLNIKNGYVVVQDTVQGVIRTRQYWANINNPIAVRTDLRPRRQLYIGPNLFADLTSFRYGGLQLAYKNRRDVMFTGGILSDFNGSYIGQAGMLFKVSFRK